MEFKTEIGGKELIIKTGDLAGQANGSCVAQYGETTVLATVVAGGGEREGVDYFPLSVDYEERFYAAGKIKGSRFIKRETRPPDEAILAGRFIDRSIRPLFNQDIRRAVQVILMVLSTDQENDPDMVGLCAASVAIAISDIPWNGPIAGVRVGQIDGEWVLNPTYDARLKSDFDLVVCGTNSRILMVEAAAKEVNDEIILAAIQYGSKHLQKINKFVKEIQQKIGKPKISLIPDLTSDEVLAKEEIERITEKIINQEGPKYLFKQPLKTKADRFGAVAKLLVRLDEVLLEKNIGKERRAKAAEYAKKLMYTQVSRAILDKDQRIDGRRLDEIRPIGCRAGILPRVHGSALFSRGETQVLSTITLGAPGEEQYLDTMEESGRKRYMHHYNFPPFSTGEAKPIRSTGRREIGHGSLVEKGILPVLPDKDDFPYTVRIVSEVLSSNGSSSMASACASILATMDAGMPIKKPVAGVAIGLASEEDKNGFKRYKILTDIQDLEDGPGGMDFKIIGTAAGITAIQMDTKTNGITMPIIQETFKASAKARAEILVKMAQAIDKPRPNLSPYAPRVIILKIDPEKIRNVIGPGGKVINEIINKTGVTIDIDQDGTVSITSTSEESMKKAVDWVKDLTRELKVGEIFQARVTKIMDFGAFAEVVPGQEGLVHVSEMAPHRVEHPSDIVKVGDVVPVKIIEIDRQGKIRLSIKALSPKTSGNRSDTYSRPRRPRPGQTGQGRRPYSPRRSK